MPLVISETSGVRRRGAGVTTGVPLPRSAAVTDTAGLRLVDEDARSIAAQFTPLARWGSGPDDPESPIRWLLVDAVADVPAGGTTTLVVERGETPSTAPSITVLEGSTGFVIDTDVARFEFHRAVGHLLGPGLAGGLRPVVTLPDGTTKTAVAFDVSVTLEGLVRSVVEVEARFSGTPLTSVTRFWFTAGSSIVRVFHTLRNPTPCPLDPSDQISCHDIGSAGTVHFDDLSLVLATELPGPLRFEAGGQRRTVTGPLTDTVLVHQASSGTASWDAYARRGTGARPRLQAHVARRGYRITLGEDMIDRGDHARGSLAVVGTGAAWRALVVDFWERFPGSLRARPDGILEIGLLPDEFGPPAFDFSLRAGEHVTHEVVLVAPGAGSMRRVGEPLAAVAPAAWYTASGALGHVVVGEGAPIGPTTSPICMPNWTQHRPISGGWIGIRACLVRWSQPTSTGSPTTVTGRSITRALAYRRST